MSRKKTIIISVIIFIGVLYRLISTANGNFLFNMDNARDMVDVREMVVLGKIRLTGPTSAIEGFYNGPAWYYLLTIPFILSGGDPYASIVMEIILWAIGGFFLMKLVSKRGTWLIIPVGSVWIASDYITLANRYAFNPNPVVLLTPLFIYLFVKYLERGQARYSSSVFLLGGLFFNFEMNFGVFIPPIIIITIIIAKKYLLKTKTFWIGSLFFLLCLLPQILFEIRHNFIMTFSVINFLRNSEGGGYSLSLRFQSIFESFISVFSATLMNHKSFTLIILLLIISLIISSFKRIRKELLALISCLYIITPFIFYLFLPVTVNPWHLGAEAAAFIILISFLIKTFWDLNFKGKFTAVAITIMLTTYSLLNIGNFVFHDRFKENLDPSSYKNEIAVIDYIYKKANGKNFKVYTFMPSIYDYPYQYLFWWYGQKKYGYIPMEYAYAPNKPQYIPSQDKFQGSKNGFSGLVFLIKEPNRGYNWKSGWEADYRFMELLSSEKLGSIEIEVRRETKK